MCHIWSFFILFYLSFFLPFPLSHQNFVPVSTRSALLHLLFRFQLQIRKGAGSIKDWLSAPRWIWGFMPKYSCPCSATRVQLRACWLEKNISWSNVKTKQPLMYFVSRFCLKLRNFRKKHTSTCVVSFCSTCVVLQFWSWTETICTRSTKKSIQHWMLSDQACANMDMYHQNTSCPESFFCSCILLKEMVTWMQQRKYIVLFRARAAGSFLQVWRKFSILVGLVLESENNIWWIVQFLHLHIGSTSPNIFFAVDGLVHLNGNKTKSALKWSPFFLISEHWKCRGRLNISCGSKPIPTPSIRAKSARQNRY